MSRYERARRGSVGNGAGQRRLRTGRGTWLPPLILAAAGALVYVNSFPGDFVFDDGKHIVENEQIRRLWPPGELLSCRRPVVELSLAVNYAISGLRPWSYHAFNLAVHLVAGLTLYGIVRRTLARRRSTPPTSDSARWLALTVVLIWLVHPLQTQSVTYLIQRGESLMGMFYLLSLYGLIRGEGSTRAVIWYALTICACALGMASKAVMVSAPLMILVYDWVFLSPALRQMLRRRWGLYVGLASTWGLLWVCGVASTVLSSSHPHATVGFSAKDLSPLDYVLTQPGVILHYLRLSFWPASLCLDYAWPVAKSVRAVIPAIAILSGIIVALVLVLRRHRATVFPVVWFFGILAPTSSFIPIRDPLFEHRMYLPLAAVVVLAVIGARAVLTRVLRDRVMRMTISVGLVIVVVTALGIRTFRRNAYYHSPIAMWNDVIDQRPSNPRAHYSLGYILSMQGRYEEAIPELRTALAIRPNYHEAHNSLGLALSGRGRTGEAAGAYQEAIRLEPRYYVAHNNLGNAYQRLGRLEDAAGAYRTALQLHADYPKARSNLASVLSQLGRLEEAVQQYREALRLAPHDPGVHSNLGVALARQGKLDAAVAQFRAAIRIAPHDVEAQINLGLALTQQGKIDGAVSVYRVVLQIDPRNPRALAALNELTGESGQP